MTNFATSPKPAAAQLEALARGEFAGLQPAEMKLIWAATGTKPACPGPTEDARHASNDPEFSETGYLGKGIAPWGADREVRAEVIRWLCISPAAKMFVDPRGLQLIGARIVGELDLRNIEIPFPISLVQCRLTSPAYFNGCQVPRLELEGSCTESVYADGACVKQSVYLQRVQVNGVLSLNLARVGGTMTCEQAIFNGADGVAIFGDGIRVSGDVYLRGDSDSSRRLSTFRARGAVRFVGAEIQGDLDCRGGEFLHPGEDCLILERVVIHGALSFDSSSKIGGFLNLMSAFAAELDDDPACWPRSGGLQLDGFMYGSITPSELAYRLSWLKLDSSTATQPYRQLAKVMADSGDTKYATSVLVEMEKKISSKEPLRWIKALIGYGYKPVNAVWLLIGLWLIGSLICWDGYRRGVIVPTDKEVFASYKPGQMTPSYYPNFQAIAFSLENTFPLVKFGQADKWQPISLSYVRLVIWAQIILGWLLATLFVAGVSGIVQHD